MAEPKSQNITSDVCVLYELSLAVGRSLDLRENCETMVRTLMARKNLACASVWIRGEYLAASEAARGARDTQALVLVYANPEVRVQQKVLPLDHPLLGRLAGREAFSVASPGKAFEDLVTERGVDRGVYAVYALGRLGVLKLLSMARDDPWTDEELNRLRNVVAKFAVSIEGCLAHEELMQEIAERKGAEEALRQSEEKYRNVVERAADGIIVLQDGLVAYINENLARLAGHSADKIVGTPFTRFVHPSEVRKTVENYKRRMAGEPALSVYETVLLDGEGRPVPVELNAGVIVHEGKTADLVFVRDIRARKKAEAEHARLALAVEQTADAVIITDTEGSILYVNPAFERITGYARAEVAGRKPNLLKSGRQDPSVYSELWSAIAQGDVWRGRLQNRRKDGTLFTCDVIITPTRDERGNVINYVGVQRDVTRELQMEEQYLQAQKMESIGRLAGGIAHDFNNIMTAVLGFGSMMLDQLQENHPFRHAVEQIVSAGERATNLTRQLLTFSRKQITDVRVLDVNAIVGEMYQLLRRALGEDVELVTDLEEEAGSVKADPSLLQQVIMNLAINARDAMPRGGQLFISTQRAALDDDFCRDRVDLRPGDYVLLAIRDTGTGMPKEVLDHLFEPFFTTKAKGKGTGLGLATVYGIVQQCGGHIEVESEVERGTEVKIWLPRMEISAEAVPVEIEDHVQKGSETVLVVEDEDMVRDLTVRVLQSLGYKVLEAPHGKAGLSIVQDHKGPIHLVLTDVVMPQMGGPEMAEHILGLRPDVKVIYTTGFTESSVVERGVRVGKLRLIQKPYTREILAQRIRKVLDEE